MLSIDSKDLAIYLMAVQKMHTVGESRESVFQYFLKSMKKDIKFQMGSILMCNENEDFFESLANLNTNKYKFIIDKNKNIFSKLLHGKAFVIDKSETKNLDFLNSEKKSVHVSNDKIKSTIIIPFYSEENMSGIILFSFDKTIKKAELDKIVEKLEPIKFVCSVLLKGFESRSLKEIYEKIINFITLPMLVFTKDHMKLWLGKNNDIIRPRKYLSEIRVSNYDLSTFNCIVCNQAFSSLNRKALKQSGENLNYGDSFQNNPNLIGKFFYECFPNMIDNKKIKTIWKKMWSTGKKSIIDVIKYYDILISEDLYSIEFVKLDQHSFMMVIHPVSEQLRAKEMIKSIAKTQEEFVGKISHELKTPVNAILSIVSLLYDSPFAKQHGESSKDFRDKLEMLSESSVTLCSLIQDILDYTQLESKSLSLSYDTFDLAECIDNALSMITLEAERKGVSLKKIITHDVPLCVVSDPKRLKQILINLLANSIKYTNDGMIKILVELDKENNFTNNVYMIKFSIQDTGIGISLIDQDKLFKPFSQVNSDKGGTGLGLIISKHLTNLLGGDIQCASELGKGSNFTFTIKAKGCSLKNMKEFYGPKLKNKSILIVDGDNYTKTRITKYLIMEGIQTMNAEDQEIAAVYLESNMYHFDLVIVSMKLLKYIENKHSNIIVILDDDDQQNNTRYPSINRDVDSDHLIQLCYSSLARLNDIKYGTLKQTFNHKVKKDLSIFVIEDDYINKKVVKDILRKMGYSSIVDAENGKHAVKVFDDNMMRGNEFDVILLDLKMPIMNGYEFFQILLDKFDDDYKGKKMPYVIALTASSEQYDKKKCLNMGMDRYVGKPIDIPELKEILENLN
jgi:signal transduction histidine kinase/CheY-like chemotaxis protein